MLATQAESGVNSISTSPQKSRHEIRSSDVIVTANLGHFPKNILGQFGIERQHPDEFVLYLFDLAPGLVVAAACSHRESLKNPPKTIEQYLAGLEVRGLTQTVAVLREWM